MERANALANRIKRGQYTLCFPSAEVVQVEALG